MSQEVDKEKDSFSFENIWMLVLSHWYWFVGCAIIALSLAFFKLLRTTPIYSASAQLLIRDDKDGGSVGMQAAFQDLGLFKSKTNINNEILTISAPVMMQETAKRLHLDLQMSVKEGFHVRPLYNDAPVKIKFPAALPDGYSFSFKLKLNSRHEAEVYDFEVPTSDGVEKVETVQTIALGSQVSTPAGKLTIEASPSWDDSFLDREITVCKYPLNVIGNIYISRLTIGLSEKESTVITLGMQDEIPARANDVILTLIDVYNEKWVKDRNRMAESTSKFIDERLASITEELNGVDNRISEYKSNNLLPDLQATLAKDMAQSQKNLDQLLQLNNQLAMVRFMRERLSDKSKDDQLLPVGMLVGSNGIEQLIGEYNRMMLDRASYVSNSSETSPAVLEIDRSLAAQKTAILRSVDNLGEQIEKQIAGVRMQDKSLNQQIAQNPRQAKDLMSVQRQQQVKEALYIFLLQKREENELSRTYTAWNTSIIQPPVCSDNPTSPKRATTMLMALVLGLAIPGAFFFMRETMNHTVRGRSDIEDIGVPFLGEVPDITQKRHWWSAKKKVARRVVVREGSQDLINEAMRMVRTKLDYFLAPTILANEGKPAKAPVVMLTSFNPGSGKSFISGNLSASIALRGKRVLAMDMDLRHCSLSYMAKGLGGTGVTAYLGGQIDDIHDVIQHDKMAPGVDVLPVGTVPPNPAELLQGPRMAKMMDILRAEYDIIMMDCPPLEIVADTSIAMKYADVCLFVVRAGLMDRRVLPQVSKLYEEKKCKNMAILLNGTKYVSGRYANYRYGYSYGYSYGYGKHNYYAKSEL